mmetsp:Transcript_17551/g.38095  ORF Transcript_17551/g.38095 Transcript_17551/m.38095 type:complete len:200 (-) Transcript_17551:94-693(-)
MCSEVRRLGYPCPQFRLDPERPDLTKFDALLAFVRSAFSWEMEEDRPTPPTRKDKGRGKDKRDDKGGDKKGAEKKSAKGKCSKSGELVGKPAPPEPTAPPQPTAPTLEDTLMESESTPHVDTPPNTGGQPGQEGGMNCPAIEEVEDSEDEGENTGQDNAETTRPPAVNAVSETPTPDAGERLHVRVTIDAEADWEVLSV